MTCSDVYIIRLTDLNFSLVFVENWVEHRLQKSNVTSSDGTVKLSSPVRCGACSAIFGDQMFEW
jgi:hypothetical protein